MPDPNADEADDLRVRLAPGDPEFTGEALRRLVVEIEAAIGMHSAGLTPLGAAVTGLCEEAVLHPSLKDVDDDPNEFNVEAWASDTATRFMDHFPHLQIVDPEPVYWLTQELKAALAGEPSPDEAKR